MSDYFGPRTPPGTVFSTSSHPPSKDKAVLRGEPFRKYAVEAILLDLIEELREAHHAEQYTLTDGHYCPICQTRASRMSSKSVDWPCDTARMADRAEARLREVQGE